VQAFEPGGWKYMLYVLAVIGSGVALYFILARRQAYWPFAPADAAQNSVSS